MAGYGQSGYGVGPYGGAQGTTTATAPPTEVTVWGARLGTEQGRIIPVNWSPTQGSYVMCLGNDLPGRKVRLAEGDFVEVVQHGSIAGHPTQRFNARTRGVSAMPQVVRVTAAGVGAYTITINGTAFTYTAGASDTVVSIAAGLQALVAAGSEPVSARMVGTADTVQLDADDPEVAYTLAVAGSLSVGTFSWRVDMIVNTSTYFTQAVRDGRTRDRWDGGGMVRNEPDDVLTGFRLTLLGTLVGSACEVELPGIYIDNFTQSEVTLADVLAMAPTMVLEPTGIVDASGSVSNWNDATPNGHDFQQTTGAERPLYIAKEASLGNNACIHIDTTSKWLQEVINTLPALTDATFFWVTDSRTPGAGLQVEIVILDAGGATFQLYTSDGAGLRGTYDSTAHRTVAGAVAGPQFSAAVYDATASTVQHRLNGANLGAAQTYDGTINLDFGLNRISANGGSAGAGWKMSHLVIFPRKLKPSDIAKVETWLAGELAG